MNIIARRILIWAATGAVGGATYALMSGPTIHSVLVWFCIGAVSGAGVGAAASMPIQKWIQTVLVGAVGGLSVGVFSFWLLGSSRSFGAHVSGSLVAWIGGFVVLRCLESLFQESTPQGFPSWAEPKNESKP